MTVLRNPLLIAVLAGLLGAGFFYQNRFPRLIRVAYIGVLLAAIVGYALLGLQTASKNLINPPRWDFQVFWLNGRVGAKGFNFYESKGFYEIAESDLGIKDDQAFAEEVLDPAFVYPPPTMFLFVPLGWFDIHTALVLWYLIQLAFLSSSVLLLWKLFLPMGGYVGLLLVTALTTILYSSQLTIQYAQLNFTMLFLSLLFIKDHNKSHAGIWVALGILVKPLLGVLLLYPLIKRQWRTVLTTGVVLALLSLTTILIFRLDNFLPYFVNNPTGRLPSWLYFETFYQSLLAVTIRMTNYNFNLGSPLLQPAFIVPAILLVGLTVFLAERNKNENKLSLSIIMLMGLLLYPHTQIYYGVLLLIPTLVVWTISDQTLRTTLIKTGFVTAIYFLSSYQSGKYTFFAIAGCWLVCVGLLVNQRLKFHRYAKSNVSSTVPQTPSPN